ncbi:MAG: lineage-specific thermal regulator protein [candidate division NC10 bacterium]|nr:lineage-specific thermal regulator protein [candidate division NC10 bacterium]
MPKKADALQGALDLLILKTLAARGPLHGYGIAVHVEAVSDDVLRMEEGSLYPALHRMEQSGWVRSSWRTSGSNHRAKFYGITATGSRQLADEERNWRQVVDAIQRVLQFA